MASASWRGLGGRLPGAPDQSTRKPAPLPKRRWGGHRVRGASRAGDNVVVRRVRGDRRAATVPGNMHLAIRRMGEPCCLRTPAGAFSRRTSSRASPSRTDASRHVDHSQGRPVGARLARPPGRGAESAQALRQRGPGDSSGQRDPLQAECSRSSSELSRLKFHALSRTLSSRAVGVNDEDGAVGVGVEDFVADAAQQEYAFRRSITIGSWRPSFICWSTDGRVCRGRGLWSPSWVRGCWWSLGPVVAGVRFLASLMAWTSTVAL